MTKSEEYKIMEDMARIINESEDWTPSLSQEVSRIMDENGFQYPDNNDDWAYIAYGQYYKVVFDDKSIAQVWERNV